MKCQELTGGITAVPGIEASGVYCGLKKGKDDLALVYSKQPARAAGVFTQNIFQAAPVLLTRRRIANRLQAIVINSGNANACTGSQGLGDAAEMARLTAEALGIAEESVAVASTGVIGEYLPMAKLADGIPRAAAALSPQGGAAAAAAIMTTDTVTKEAAVRAETGGISFTVGGMAKGSGMICPHMATMLAFIATDLEVERPLLQRALSKVADRTFNMITVDGDTSTNDMVLLLANGAGAQPPVNSEGPLLEAFTQALEQVCRRLARKIVKDGEGATHLITVHVKGAADFTSGRRLAMAVLNSNLVKTAIFGRDANWGRIITALGYAGVPFVPERVDVYLGDLAVAQNGRGVPFDERKALAILEQEEVVITVDIKIGGEEVTAWGSDLSYDYITINASYRT